MFDGTSAAIVVAGYGVRNQARDANGIVLRLVELHGGSVHAAGGDSRAINERRGCCSHRR
jgi:hypothetical protein